MQSTQTAADAPPADRTAERSRGRIMLEVCEHNRDDCIKLINLIICEMPLIKTFDDDCLLERLSQLMAILEASYESDDGHDGQEGRSAANETAGGSVEPLIRQWLMKYYNAKYFIEALNFSDGSDRSKIAVLIIHIMCKLRHSLQDIKAYLDDCCPAFDQFDEQLNHITRFDKLLEIIQLDLNKWKSEARHYKVKLDEFTKLFEMYEQNGIRPQNKSTCDKASQVRVKMVKRKLNVANNTSCETASKSVVKKKRPPKVKPIVNIVPEVKIKTEINACPEMPILNTQIKREKIDTSYEVNELYNHLINHSFSEKSNEENSVNSNCVNNANSSAVDKELSFICYDCNKLCANNYEYNLHLLNEHAVNSHNEMPTTCSDVKTKKRKTLSKRMKSDRKPLEKTFKCTFNGCVKAFARGYELKRHSRTHEPKISRLLHVCDYPNCGKRYTALNHLNVHKKKKHLLDEFHHNGHQNGVESLTSSEELRRSESDAKIEDIVECCRQTLTTDRRITDSCELNQSFELDTSAGLLANSSLIAAEFAALIDHQYSL